MIMARKAVRSGRSGGARVRGSACLRATPSGVCPMNARAMIAGKIALLHASLMLVCAGACSNAGRPGQPSAGAAGARGGASGGAGATAGAAGAGGGGQTSDAGIAASGGAAAGPGDGRVGDSDTVEAPNDVAPPDGGPQDSKARETPPGTGTTSAWTGTWASAPQSCGGSFTGQTLREIVHTSIGGSVARVRFSNTFGGGPLQVRDVHLAARTAGSSVDPTTDVALTFGGQALLTVPAGAYAVSDPADFGVKRLSDVAVSFYVVSQSATTCHQSGFQTNYQASGDVSGNETIGDSTNGSYDFLSNLDVGNPLGEGAVVALGASITDGYRSNGDDNKRWPNDLAVRLVMAGRGVGVLNEGISGDGVANAVQRFDRDVLSQPNVKWVIFSDNPINDLGNFDPPAQTEIDQIKSMIASAHAHGVAFLCSTLTPFQGAAYWSAQKETGRAGINSFIRGAGSGCDGVIDQDTATHDPTNPTTYLPAFNSGDSLHPNEAGLQAIANAVDLSLLQ
jgi:lysophospholipase L1-like esterase